MYLYLDTFINYYYYYFLTMGEMTTIYGVGTLVQELKARGINVSKLCRDAMAAYLNMPDGKDELERDIAETRARLAGLEERYQKLTDTGGWKEYSKVLLTWLVEKKEKGTEDKHLFIRWKYLTQRKDTFEQFKSYLEEVENEN